MTATTRLVLPWPPTINHYYGRRPIGGVYIKPRGKLYRQLVWAKLRNVETVHGRLAVRLMACPPDRRVRDLDNVLKASLDAITHAGVIEDDKHIDDLHITRESPMKGGKLVVEIRSLEES